MRGILIYYFATGECGRPQFIDYRSLDSKNRVINYDYIYDLEEGDKIKILNANFTDQLLTIDKPTYLFLSYFVSGWRGPELEVEFAPHGQHKSWGETINEYNLNNGNVISGSNKSSKKEKARKKAKKKISRKRS